MMNFRKTLAAILCATLVLGITACEEGGEPLATTPAATSATTTANTLDDDINNPVDISEVVEEEATLENPNLKYFGFYDMRVAGDIKPGVKLFEETYGGKIDYIECTWAEHMDKLLSLIASDDSPDLVDKLDNSFPHFMSKKAYTDLTDYIDLSLPQWEGYGDLVEAYAWNGCHYYYPFTANALANCLIYSKTLFDQYGITDPKEQYDSGTWTWKAFKDAMIDFMAQGGENVVGGVYGLLGTDIILSTGTPLVGSDGAGKAVNNMATQPVERAAAFLEEIRKEGLTARGDGMWSNESAPLANGKVAFLGVGQWKITDFCKNYSDMEWGFVPFPRDEGADEYYFSNANFGYMVPTGSKNVEGAAAFINIMRKCQTDPELKKIVKTSIMNDKCYSEEQYDFITSFEDISKFHMVINMSYGFNSEMTNIIDNMLVNVAYSQGDDQQTWATLRSSNEGAINDIISQYNPS